MLLYCSNYIGTNSTFTLHCQAEDNREFLLVNTGEVLTGVDIRVIRKTQT